MQSNIPNRLKITQEEMYPKGMKMLREIYIETIPITHLDLSNNMNSETVFQITSKILKITKTLKYLDLRYTHMGNKKCEILSKGLKHNNSLIWLNLQDNIIESEGLVNISRALKRNKSLIHLNLSNNWIKDNACINFSEMLKQNETLTEIDLGHNVISSKGVNHLIKALKINENLIELCLDVNEIEDQHFDDRGNDEIKFLLECNNKKWSAEIHSTLSTTFRNSILIFVLILKRLSKESKMKIPKFVLFEIIKMIDRKAYFELEFTT